MFVALVFKVCNVVVFEVRIRFDEGQVEEWLNMESWRLQKSGFSEDARKIEKQQDIPPALLKRISGGGTAHIAERHPYGDSMHV